MCGFPIACYHQTNMATASDKDADAKSTCQQLTICHLKNDCLENIFCYLNLNDLVNVAESNVYLAVIAGNFFALKFPVFMYNCYETKINDETFLLILNRFRENIQKLHVKFSRKLERDRTIFDAIIKDCRAYVQELSFGYLHETVALDQPFPKVTKLELVHTFGDCSVHRSILELSSWFPQLNSLKIQNVCDFWGKIHIKQYQALEEFSFFNFPNRDRREDVEKMARFFYENPQLTILAMDEISGENMQLFSKYAPKQVPSIRSLDVVSPHPYPYGPIKFPNLRDLKLSFYANKVDTFAELPSTLESFELRIPKLTASALSFILKCKQNLRKLNLIIFDAIEIEQMEKIALEMQALTELFIYRKNFDINASKIPTGLENVFLHGKQMKTIHLKYELSTFNNRDQAYKAEIESMEGFLKTINDRSKSYWKMGHKMCLNDHYRSQMLCMYPFLLITFKKWNLYLE